MKERIDEDRKNPSERISIPTKSQTTYPQSWDGNRSLFNRNTVTYNVTSIPVWKDYINLKVHLFVDPSLRLY